MSDIGGWIGNVLGFDPTPGFNLGWQHGSGADPVVPTIVGSGVNPRAPKAAAVSTPVTHTSPAKTVSNTPASTPTVNYSYAGGGSTATPTSDPSTASYYQDMMDQLNGQIGRLDNQQNVGMGNINSSYNEGYNRLNTQKSQAQRNYDTQVQHNTQSYLSSRNGIMDNTRATANALQRLLGLNGAGNSSAAYEQAPYAAGLQGSQNLNHAQQTYSNNADALNTNWGDYNTQFKNSLEDLNQQKYQQMNGLKSSIAQTRANLLDKIAQAGVNKNLALGQNYDQAKAARTPYQNQINTLLDQITGLGNQYAHPILQAKAPTYDAPSLDGFTLGNMGNIQDTGGAQSNVDPTFLGLLTGQKRDQFGNPLA